ncbi:hypothetical protein SAMN05192558_104115 [Actinokineospora alba]|uniref:ApeA N-terminal domain-containing protein n=1 Tax=Actinokineospora alba TaxID=504798 RepID=A0A1H0LEH9_9PSEU|nr:hypothetical protein [Actinokineospora alba]TDP67296.1 hypothetical protein C8E96_2834 [Actinokineospora alba]SDJ01315.1 hypothetical protein SAMN05421871_109182 [Actinokineospora alba]SDO66515.1 hypothetical protein SAMN05192558_104115 [Actinokineospora alba]
MELGLKLTPWGNHNSSSSNLARKLDRALHLSDGVDDIEIPLRLDELSVVSQLTTDLSSDLMLLPEHAGIIQVGRGYVEAIIEDVNARSGAGSLRPYSYRVDSRVFASQDGAFRHEPGQIIFAPTAEGITVEISRPSALFTALESRLSPPFVLLGDSGEDLVTLKISGAKLHDQAHGHAVLKAVASSCSIGLEARFGRGFVLSPRFDWKGFWERGGARSPQRPRPEVARQPLPLILNAYADTAVSYYWDARKLESVPIHAYNAYYKVLENHFQRYAVDSGIRLLRRKIRDPHLDLSDDHDAAALLAAVQDHGRKRNSKEELLAMTLAICVEPHDLAKFIASDVALSRHLARRDILPGIPVISKATRRDELVKRVAERLSKLRNQTVHAEGEIEDGRNLLLVPGSPAALSVSEDVKLIRHCALAVIIASSRPLDVERL